jgi:glycosyltransferase involved in cell wall biosynthesis
VNILWLLDIKHQYGLRHGATLRYVNLAKRLVARGHRVYFVLTNYRDQDLAPRNSYLDKLRDAHVFTDYVEVDSYTHPRLLGKLSWLAIHPRARNAMLASQQAEYKSKMVALMDRFAADVCMISQRACLILLPEITGVVPTIVDWCDSASLLAMREIPLIISSGNWKQVPSEGRNLVRAVTDEAFYSRYSANIIVSKVDKKMFDRLNGRPTLNHVLSNGVDLPLERQIPVKKDPQRLIISGSMDYPPNYSGALWFIDKVMPILLGRNPDLQVVIAGQKPVPELLAKANRNIVVTGEVPDLGSEIARSQLFLAPLFSGSGFKNKVVEALANETYVLGTPMALEFLDGNLRSKLLVAKSPTEFATCIERYLKGPQDFAPRLEEAIQIVREEYLWESRVEELEELCLETREQWKTHNGKGTQSSCS